MKFNILNKIYNKLFKNECVLKNKNIPITEWITKDGRQVLLIDSSETGFIPENLDRAVRGHFNDGKT